MSDLQSRIGAPNIFTLFDDGDWEDRFTSLWHYLLDAVEGAGQGVVNYLAQGAGIAPSTFISAEDHPPGTDEDRPDFLIACQDYDIICEHKIAAPLGERQLERYLALPRSRPSYLVLIARDWQRVEEGVLNDPRYLHPATGGANYRWCDLFAIVNKLPHRLAQDFSSYMRARGLAPLDVPSWEDLLTNVRTAEVFASAMDKTRAWFAARGARCKRDPTYLGLQIRNSHPWQGLLYLRPHHTTGWDTPLLNGVALTARLYLVRGSAHAEAFFASTPGLIEDAFGTVARRPKRESVAWDPELILVTEYAAPLSTRLHADSEETRNRLLAFGMSVQGDIDAVVKATAKLTGQPVASSG